MAANSSLNDMAENIASLHRVLSVKEAATRVGLSKSTLDKLRIYGGGRHF
jgi:DNA-binding Xre family transcriptional regulator